ncbi:MAG: Hsp70 family protein, partial [Alphaproteobacteria bacterium]|nr:Hsp70 family protein [Alphaproteobacteria bacterium]
DFIEIILAAFLAGPGRDAGLPPIGENASLHAALRRQAELAKRKLSCAEHATIEIVHNGRPIAWTLTRDAFEALSEPILKRLRAPIERALREARIAPEELSQIVLAGGASRMPVFRRLVSRLFGRLPLQTINPDEVVGRGAAMRAGLQMRERSLEEIVVTDVTPFTLGIEVSKSDREGRISGLFLPIIDRNTVIPTSRSQTVSPVEARQSTIELNIYQGEARRVRDNIRLGSLTVRVPRAATQNRSVEVRFTYDTSGLIEVEATVLATGRRERLVIEGNPGILSREEIEKRLASLSHLKIHPRDQAENTAVIARAERLYEERLDLREAVANWLDRFLAMIEGQNPQHITTARLQLVEFLDTTDTDFFV